LSHLYDFADADGSNKDLFGGKGAGLAEMTRLGLPVPPGFIITTDVCRLAMENGHLPDDLWDQVDAAVARLENTTGRTFGSGPTPILLSVRSGAKFSMPGMMDTVLNIGINDDIVAHLADWSGDAHFAWDAYRRFIQMYADVVLGVPDSVFQDVLTNIRDKRGVSSDSELTTADLERATHLFAAIVDDQRPGELPSEPREQLRGAIAAVFDSWSNKRAVDYRQINNIPEELGTAANVQMMVFGDLGEDSGTGVCFTRDPATGARASYGDYLPRAQGEDVVAGIRNTMSLDELAGLHERCHQELLEIMDRLERHYRDMCDIEFTIEHDRLYILQTRVGKRTAEAAVRLAVTMANEGLIDRKTAISRVRPAALEQLHRPRIDTARAPKPVTIGVAASPGAAAGKVVFSSDRAVEMAHAGAQVILVRPETTPDDIHGMAAAIGILTSKGGKTSHAAVVARGMGKPAVTGVAELVVDPDARIAHVLDSDFHEGDEITIDGTSGAIYVESVPLIEPEGLDELVELLSWADEIRMMGVWANADTRADAEEARRRGAEGIGLARTEHMFLGERLNIVQRVILAIDKEHRDQALDDLEKMQIEDFEGLLEAMDGLPVVVRLLDPPLHEFLPSRFELERETLRRVRAGRPIEDLQVMSEVVARWEEVNPMLGLRGVRLGLMLNQLYRMQTRAAITAYERRLAAGGNPILEIMVPLVATAEELRRCARVITSEIGEHHEIRVGTMIELRAAPPRVRSQPWPTSSRSAPTTSRR
jgi:pyruvate,orthophosphate dikinase